MATRENIRRELKELAELGETLRTERVADALSSGEWSLFRRDRARNRKAQEIRRHYRHHPHVEQVDELEPAVRFVDVVQDQVGLAIVQPLPRPGDGLEMQMQPGAGTVLEKTARSRPSISGNGINRGPTGLDVKTVSRRRRTCQVGTVGL